MLENQKTNQLSQMQIEVREYLPWSSENPSAPTCKEIYKQIYQARHKGIMLSGPKDYFGGSKELPAIAKRPMSIRPKWEIKTNTEKPKFSFVIPTFNQADFLTSILRQLSKLKAERGSWEVIVVDDGSPESVLASVKSYLCDEDLAYNLKYFHWAKPQKIFRAGEARNLGVDHAQGEVIMFLDSDILVPFNFLDEVESSLKRASLVQFVREHIHPKYSNVHTSFESVTSEQCYIEEEKYWLPFFESDSWEEIPFFWKYTCSYALAIRKADFNAIRGFNPCFITYGFEDTDLGYRLFKEAKRFELNKTKLLHLTSPTTESLWITQMKRQEALSKTAKIFFLAHLDPEIYEHFHFYMMDSGVWRARLLRFLREKINF